MIWGCARIIASTLFIAAITLAVTSPSFAARQDPFRLKPIDRVALRAIMASIDEGNFDQARDRARNSRDGALIDLVTWFTLNDRTNRAGFGVFRRFIDEHSDWPGQGALLLRAEQALPGSLSSKALVAWFAKHPPVSGHGLLVYLDALRDRRREDVIAEVVKDYWQHIGTTPAIERRLRDRFGSYVDEELDFGRLDRLLLERRAVEARRTAKYLGNDYEKLARARIVLADNSGGADAAIAEVPERLQDDPGLALQRATWRRNKRRAEAAAELLLGPAGKVNRPDIWWRERRIVARALFNNGKPEIAYDVIVAGSMHQVGGTDWALAEFFAGYLAQVHLGRPELAALHFRRLHDNAETPITKARAAYWMGRALAVKPETNPEAERWFKAAASYPWVYYGQRAADRLGTVLDLPAPPPLSAAAARRFSRQSSVRLVEGLSSIGRNKLATRFISALISNAESPVALHAIAALSNSIGRPDMVVAAAREASRNGYALIPAGHPRPDEPKRLAIDPLSLAIIRQESQFKPTARSTAGAVGLMQIMPATAKYTAKRIGIAYDRAKLGRDVDYNVMLGTAIVDAALEQYDGRLPLVAAAYNAGGTQLSRWLRANGDPGNDADAMDDFIEAIPFPETRNYVHRVLENERIYRELLARTERQEATR